MWKRLTALSFTIVLAGAMGCSGDDGATGATGPEGKQGPAGQPGSTGAPGDDGTNGTNGTNGQDGENGQDGQDGVDPTINNTAPSAADDSTSTPRDMSVIIDVLANDTDSDSHPLVVSSVTQPSQGAVEVNGDQTIRYVPDGVFKGTDTFDYTTQDIWGETSTATVTVTVLGDSVFTLGLLHHSDGESKLLHAGSGLESYGGIARFKTLVDRWRGWADQRTHGTIMVSSGDNFLAGAPFSASLNDPAGTIYDAVGLGHIGYDAICLGNHDFDFGPSVLADFIDQTTSAPFLSANLDFSQEPLLDALVTSGRIAASVVVERSGESIGIVGATTPDITSISSPGLVQVDPNVAAAVQAEVDALVATGVNKIILISHLQSVNEDKALAGEIEGVDIMVAGGGDDLFANPWDALLPNAAPTGDAYPFVTEDKAGNPLYIVSTDGNYRYIGVLLARFDAYGRVIGWDEVSGPKRVTGVMSDVDYSAMDATVQADVTVPVESYIAAMAANVIATAGVNIDGTKNTLRTSETNEGDLVADALLWQAKQIHAAFGAPEPQIAIQNSGGIRNESIIPAGADISEATTFEILAFDNKLAVVTVGPDVLKEVLENAYSKLPTANGRFAQVAGMSVEVDPSRPGRVIDSASKQVTTPGERVRSVVLDGGTPVVTNGAVDAAAPTNVVIATIDFLVRPLDGTPVKIVGGDEYPFGASPDFTLLGATYQQALFNYLQAPASEGGLEGVVTAAAYPADGNGRITILP